MKIVFKCDFCSFTNENFDIVSEHEKMCPFNSLGKKCYTCEHSYEAGYPISGHIPGCEIKLDADKGERIGNCTGWTSIIEK